MSAAPVRACLIVVPVHNEDELLARCLRSIRPAVQAARVPCIVRVVLDACTDDSARIAAEFAFTTLTVKAQSVGVARAAGVSSAMRELRSIPYLAHLAEDHIWIANTDADSVVPPHWLAHQSALAEDGADMMVGTVRPDFADLTPAHRQHWVQTHTRGVPNGHTHGANLGLRASLYGAVGGFAPRGLDEDVQLVEDARALGARIVASDEAEVMTSGRIVGRASGGYADHLRDVSAAL